ncbi:hypothetical protein PPERSA_06228 [Pseudocohnilembus persalinus]|uniref:RRM domain-containing protein n=1 Tax=Pseudocohnilembus persalinus TaxID=266149 RepID=A0A0V0R0J4_PSEPJ|nr:hypothetical protein PPERSA_06228 [Pseudocohnilembus persalinus]|eukprot:KRX08050.1 hypothetical protein PPERSA_06228 [Pseudocohnilembus persalinus]
MSLIKTLILSNLPESVQESDIRVLLSGLSDEIEYIKVQENKIAFVVLTSEDDIDQAQMYDGSEMGGHEITIETVDDNNKEQFEKFEIQYVQRKLHKQKSQNLLQELQSKDINDKLIFNEENNNKPTQEPEKEENSNNENQQKIADFQKDTNGESTPTKEDFQRKKIKVNSEVFNKLTQSQQQEFNSSQNSFNNSESFNDLNLNQNEQKTSQINPNMQEIKETHQEHMQNSNIQIKNPDLSEKINENEIPHQQEKEEELIKNSDNEQQQQEKEEGEIINSKNNSQLQEEKEDKEKNQEEKTEIQQQNQEETNSDRSFRKSAIINQNEEDNLIKKLAAQKNNYTQQKTENQDTLSNQQQYKEKNLQQDEQKLSQEKNVKETFEYDFSVTKVQYGFAIAFLILFFFFCQLVYKVLDIERVVFEQQQTIDSLLNSTLSHNQNDL